MEDGSGKVESPYELQEDLSRVEGEFLQVESPGKLGVKYLGWYLVKVSLGHERRFKILPKNGAKMLSHKL
jgi:hypothetical protein